MAGPAFEIMASRRIGAAAEVAYAVFADYRVAHPRILPPRFFTGMEVKAGGWGAGTVVLVTSRVLGREMTICGFVTEPEPGRVLVASYPKERMTTTFEVEPEGEYACRVTISTLFPRAWGPFGWLQERFVRYLLLPVYEEELGLAEAWLANHALR